LLRFLGPGLVTGAADDNPSGIATYSQLGAQFGFATLLGLALNLTRVSPIKGLLWSAVINGLCAGRSWSWSC